MAKPSDQDRKKLKDGKFAEPEKRKEPMEDETHARNALSRVSANGSKAEHREIQKNVEKKYPDLEKD
jgi:hypothetical protein